MKAQQHLEIEHPTLTSHQKALEVLAKVKSKRKNNEYKIIKIDDQTYKEVLIHEKKK